MSMDAKVQVPPDSTGANVRTIQVTTIVDGLPVVVDMQVLALADENGNVIQHFIDYEWQREALDELKRIRTGLQRLVNDSLNIILP